MMIQAGKRDIVILGSHRACSEEDASILAPIHKVRVEGVNTLRAVDELEEVILGQARNLPHRHGSNSAEHDATCTVT